jgi:hypothetical protein
VSDGATDEAPARLTFGVGPNIRLGVRAACAEGRVVLEPVLDPFAPEPVDLVRS